MEEQTLSARNIAKWGSFQTVESREFSYLLDPGPFGDGTETARQHGFQSIWGQLKQIAEQNGFEILDRPKNPFRESLNTREYFDTADFALRNKGFLIRVATDYAKGKPKNKSTLVVKENSSDDFNRVFQSKLEFGEAFSGETGIEENVFLNRDRRLENSLEVAKKIKLDSNALGKRTLGDFGNVIPQLLELGLADSSSLTRHMTYSYDVKPGHVVLTPSFKARIKLEIWTRKQNADPFIGDLSFEVMTENYDDMADVHTQAERFSAKVLGQHGGNFAFPNAARWGGSKTRLLLNLPDKEA